MDGVFDGSWQVYPMAALALFGAGLALHSLRRLVQGLGSPSPDSATLLTGLRGFRLAVIGLALVGVAGAWWWGEVWLLVLSLGIAGEETLETSMMIWALNQERRRVGMRQQRHHLSTRVQDSLPASA
jgi:hypothetical protein